MGELYLYIMEWQCGLCGGGSDYVNAGEERTTR